MPPSMAMLPLLLPPPQGPVTISLASSTFNCNHDNSMKIEFSITCTQKTTLNLNLFRSYNSYVAWDTGANMLVAIELLK